MQFRKSALTVDQQIDLLENRGMVFADRDKAKKYLSHISYYRLSAYWYTFLKKPQSEHLFRENTLFEEVLNTYIFDRKLRLLVFDEIERIEIAIRTQIIYHYCHEFGNNWFENKTLFKSEDQFRKFQIIVSDAVNKSSETFILHYKSKYAIPSMPPAWMTLELVSFGQLSMLYKSLKVSTAKKEIANHFGLNFKVLESWLESISFLRNSCAHHSRIWNRKVPKPIKIPITHENVWLENLPTQDKRNRIYLVLAAIKYMLNIIVPNTSFGLKIMEIVHENQGIPISYMGFPTDWYKEELWK